jgi:hypothetical protein
MKIEPAKLEKMKAYLPTNVQDMAQRIGLPATLTVVENLGGISWHVAQGTDCRGAAKRTALAALVGDDIEVLLHREYAGDVLYLARCHTALIKWRNMEIIQRVEKGLREKKSLRTLMAELAREYELSDRWILAIISEATPTTEQPDLFDD